MDVLYLFYYTSVPQVIAIVKCTYKSAPVIVQITD